MRNATNDLHLSLTPSLWKPTRMCPRATRIDRNLVLNGRKSDTGDVGECQMTSRSGIDFRTMPETKLLSSRDYSIWLDQWVVLKVAAGELQTELVCTVIAESDRAIR